MYSALIIQKNVGGCNYYESFTKECLVKSESKFGRNVFFQNVLGKKEQLHDCEVYFGSISRGILTNLKSSDHHKGDILDM